MGVLVFEGRMVICSYSDCSFRATTKQSFFILHYIIQSLYTIQTSVSSSSIPSSNYQTAPKIVGPCYPFYRENSCLLTGLGRKEEYVDYIPGLKPIKLTNFPVVDQRFRGILPDLASINKKAQFLVLSTVYELEPEAIDAIKHKFKIPVHTFGPNIPNLQLQPAFPSNKPTYFSWLDSKPARSVLYISLGSYLSVSSAQMDEIFFGLKESGVNFLLIARGEAFSRFSKDCGSNGLVTEWCDQLRVLLHSSVGGCFSHCGWNSIKESVFSGVPILTFPITGEQVVNSEVVVEDWKVGRKVKTGRNLVARAEIAAVVRRFMDGESGGRKEMMERVKKIEGVCRESVGEGGSVIREIDSFIRDHFKGSSSQ